MQMNLWGQGRWGPPRAYTHGHFLLSSFPCDLHPSAYTAYTAYTTYAWRQPDQTQPNHTFSMQMGPPELLYTAYTSYVATALMRNTKPSQNNLKLNQVIAWCWWWRGGRRQQLWYGWQQRSWWWWWWWWGWGFVNQLQMGSRSWVPGSRKEKGNRNNPLPPHIASNRNNSFE